VQSIPCYVLGGDGHGKYGPIGKLDLQIVQRLLSGH
jgi:hypothetical protein